MVRDMSATPPTDCGREGEFTRYAFVRGSYHNNVRIYFSTLRALECVLNFKTWHRNPDATIDGRCGPWHVLATGFTRSPSTCLNDDHNSGFAIPPRSTLFLRAPTAGTVGVSFLRTFPFGKGDSGTRSTRLISPRLESYPIVPKFRRFV